MADGRRRTGASTTKNHGAPRRPTRRPRLKALVFGADVTIVAGVRELHRAAFNAAFAAAGLAWEWDLVQYGKLLRAARTRDMLRHWVRYYRPCDVPRRNRLAFLEALHRRKDRHYRELLPGAPLAPQPGLLRLLREARAEGLVVVVATPSPPGSTRALIRRALGSRGMGLFDVIGVREDLPAGPPDPAIRRRALELVGCDPGEAISFEGSAAGCAAARADALAVIVVQPASARNESFDGAGLVVGDYGEPGRPFTVFAGDPGKYDHVSIPALRTWRRTPMTRTG